MRREDYFRMEDEEGASQDAGIAEREEGNG